MSHDRYGGKGDESPRLGLWEDQGINIGLEGWIGGMLRAPFFPYSCSAPPFFLTFEISHVLNTIASGVLPIVAHISAPRLGLTPLLCCDGCPVQG